MQGSLERGRMDRLIAQKEWAGSPLGPAAAWPSSLRTVLRLMLASRYAMWMGWGPELVFFYNDAYAAQTLGAKHPWALGRSAREVWAEIWDAIGPLIEKVLQTGEATWNEGLLLLLERSGYPEETYHTFSYSRAPADSAGEIGGLFCVVIEETERVIGERRIALLGRFASLLGPAKALDEVYAAVEACLTAEARDVPFSLTYVFDDDGKTAKRVSKTGFDDSGPDAPLEVLVGEGNPWPLGAVLASGAPVLIHLDPRRSWPMGPWKIAPSRALLLPIARPGESRLAGVFVAGMNPHRPIDDTAVSFFRLFVGQLTAGLSSAGAYEQERKRAEALAEVDRAKTTFFSNVSHEFRTPLTLMLAPIEDMLASDAAGEERERVELLHRNAIRLLKLVNTLLDFSRIEAARVEAVFEATDLAVFTAELASNFRSAIKRARLDFRVDCPPLGELVFVDRGMWEKIVLNLLSNAFKFTLDGSISVRLRLAGTTAELEIADTGTGIAEGELPRLFERFHRVEGARARSHEGSGIGLALVHELVRMHGGTIEVASRLGHGTTFHVHIPRGQEHLAPARIRAPTALQPTAVGAEAYVEEALRWISPATDSSPPSGGDEGEGRASQGGAVRRSRIVVADDNADMRRYLTRLLRERWDVEPVANGREALEAIRREPPDLVLADVMMPELDGFGLLRALRGDTVLRTTPVVLLSARAGEEATSEGLRAGADDYIVKPFAARELLVRIAARLAAAKGAKDAIEQRRNLYRHFMQAPFPIAIHRGPDLRIELVNAASLKAWGKGEDILGMPARQALPELEGQPFFPLLEEVYRTGVPYEGRETLARLATGPGGELEDAYFTFVYAPLFDLDGRVEGLLTCGFDVTSSVRARQQTDRALEDAVSIKQRALEEAEQTNRAKDEFLATMSHELRTPLNAMLGWASMLKKDASDRALVDHGLTVIERNAHTQARLVSDLLDVSRIISGKLRLSMKRTDLTTVVHAAVDVVRPAADAKGVRLVLDLDPEAGATLADPDRLQQIVWNVVSNAVRFTPARGRVTVSAHRTDSIVRLRVQDTGSGIALEHLPYIFERFRQIDSSMTRAHGGLGLGLAIVRHLVEAHGGTVTADSEGAGRGATFTITLPIRAVLVPEDAADHDVEAEEPGSGERARPDSDASEPADLRQIRVLVVDDERDSLELLRLVLEGAGATVTAVESAAAALDARGPFDLIISDIGMPEMDGYTFIRRIRSREKGIKVPAIALTAYARAEDADRASRSGYQEHLAKPVDAGKLVEAVHAWTRATLTERRGAH